MFLANVWLFTGLILLQPNIFLFFLMRGGPEKLLNWPAPTFIPLKLLLVLSDDQSTKYFVGFESRCLLFICQEVRFYLSI